MAWPKRNLANNTPQKHLGLHTPPESFEPSYTSRFVFAFHFDRLYIFQTSIAAITHFQAFRPPCNPLVHFTSPTVWSNVWKVKGHKFLRTVCNRPENTTQWKSVFVRDQPSYLQGYPSKNMGFTEDLGWILELRMWNKLYPKRFMSIKILTRENLKVEQIHSLSGKRGIIRESNYLLRQVFQNKKRHVCQRRKNLPNFRFLHIWQM